MIDEGGAGRSVLGLMTAGALWPSLYGALTYAFASPLDRALMSAWCGAAPHGATLFLGHCINCWTGAAALFAAAALIGFARRGSVAAIAALRASTQR